MAATVSSSCGDSSPGGRSGDRDSCPSAMTTRTWYWLPLAITISVALRMMGANEVGPASCSSSSSRPETASGRMWCSPAHANAVKSAFARSPPPPPPPPPPLAHPHVWDDLRVRLEDLVDAGARPLARQQRDDGVVARAGGAKEVRRDEVVFVERRERRGKNRHRLLVWILGPADIMQTSSSKRSCAGVRI